MHRKYGPNLSGFRRAVDRAEGKLGDSASDNVEDWNGVDIDLSSVKMAFVGAISGMQISEESNGKCFYTALDTIDFTKTLANDWGKINYC